MKTVEKLQRKYKKFQRRSRMENLSTSALGVSLTMPASPYGGDSGTTSAPSPSPSILLLVTATEIMFKWSDDYSEETNDSWYDSNDTFPTNSSIDDRLSLLSECNKARLSYLDINFRGPRFLVTGKLPAIPAHFHLKVVVATVVQAVTFFGNLLVLYAFATTKKLRTYANYYIAGLAVTDLFSGGVFAGMENIKWFFNYWPLDEYTCAISGFCNHVFLHATFLMTLVICYDRFRALNMPLRHLQEKTLKHACLLMSLSYIIPLLIWTPLVVLLPYAGVMVRIKPPQCSGAYTCYPPLIVFACIVLSWVPLAGTTILYAFVYSAVIRKSNRRKRSGGENASSDYSAESRAGRGTNQDTAGQLCPTDGTDKDVPEVNPSTEDLREQGQLNADAPEIRSISADVAAAAAAAADAAAVGVTNVAYEPTEDEDVTAKNHPEKQKTNGKVRGWFSSKHATWKQRRSSKRDARLASLRATRTLTYILVVMLISAIPWSISSLVLAINPLNPTLTSGEAAVLYWIVRLSSAANPFCYAVCNPLFKEAFLRILTCGRRGQVSKKK